jgi:predicted RNA-binding protein with PIN domain
MKRLQELTMSPHQTFLIDGYNLLHALGLANRQMPKGKLERARRQMLDWLAEGLGPIAEDASVVFDAPQVAGPQQPEQHHRGIAVRFCSGQLADDWIEQFIAQVPQPKRLTLVSNDHRIQDAARHRGCSAWTCQHFIDWLLARGSQKPAAVEEKDAKPEAPVEGEVQEWLRAFGSDEER